MIAVLKHNGFPKSCCFQIENTGSKLEDNTGMSQITELSIVNWAILMCTLFDFCSHVWLRNANKMKSKCADNFPCGLLKTLGFAVFEKLYPFVQALFHMKAASKILYAKISII